MSINEMFGKLPEAEKPSQSKLIRRCIIAVIILVALIALYALAPFATVLPGYVGVKSTFGSVSSEVYESGPHFRLPIAQSMHSVYVGVNKRTSDVGGSSKDLQQVDMRISVNFNILPTAAANIYTTYDSDPWTTVMDPAVHDIAKAVAARYDATDLIQKRDEVSQAMRSELLTRFSNIGVNISAVNIVDFQFSKQFNDAIEAKITAQQNAQRVENEIVQTKWEAQKSVVESEAALKVAENTAKANQILGASLATNTSLLEKMKIEKWDGHYPQYVMGNAVPMIQIAGRQ